eukprot:Amastigsp_a681907_9.p4 type:complete len:311 gc:universal Amastigsp_a681907_9:1060-128(-)
MAVMAARAMSAFACSSSAWIAFSSAARASWSSSSRRAIVRSKSADSCAILSTCCCSMRLKRRCWRRSSAFAWRASSARRRSSFFFLSAASRSICLCCCSRRICSCLAMISCSRARSSSSLRWRSASIFSRSTRWRSSSARRSFSMTQSLTRLVRASFSCGSDLASRRSSSLSAVALRLTGSARATLYASSESFCTANSDWSSRSASTPPRWSSSISCMRALNAETSSADQCGSSGSSSSSWILRTISSIGAEACESASSAEPTTSALSCACWASSRWRSSSRISFSTSSGLLPVAATRRAFSSFHLRTFS